MTNNQKSMAKMMAATAMSQSLNLTFRRDYLRSGVWTQGVASIVNPTPPISRIPPLLKQFHQIGKPNADPSAYFQRVLRSLHRPNDSDIVFVLKSDGIVCELYIGIQEQAGSSTNILDGACNLLRANFPGTLLSETISSRNLSLNNHLNSVSCLTGVPDVADRNSAINRWNFVDSLIPGMRGRPFAYIVFASPICPSQIDTMIFICREMQGQAESLSNLSLTEAQQENFTKGWQQTVSTSESNSERNMGAGLMLAGLGLAAGFAFPPALAAMGLPLSGMAAGMAPIAGVGLLSSFAPSNTKTSGKSEGTSEGYTSGMTQTISTNYVNKHVEAMAVSLGHWTARLEKAKTHGFWKTQAYILTHSEHDLQVANLLAESLLNGQNTELEPIRAHDLNRYWEFVISHLHKMQPPVLRLNQPQSHPLGSLYCELSTPLNTEELGALIQMPTRSVPGINVIQVPEEASQTVKPKTETSIELGQQIYTGSVTDIIYPLEIDEMAKHTLICGISGSGKTTTTQRILNEILLRKEPVPFLVIEPSKDEYLHWALRMNRKNDGSHEKINVFVPYKGSYVDGQYDDVELLRLNPFEVIRLSDGHHPNVLGHIDSLKAILTGALPMQEVLPILLEELLYEAYRSSENDWLNAVDDFEGLVAPTLVDCEKLVEKIVSSKRYESKIAFNLTAALKGRINSFLQGWKRGLFNPNGSNGEISTPWKILFEKPTVICLDGLKDQADCAFTMSLILLFLSEYRQAKAFQENSKKDIQRKKLSHLTVIEEAHRVMPNIFSAGASENNSQFMASRMFSNMLSEFRALGEGMLICEQIPSRLISDAIKNTNTKIVHKTVACDDRQVLAGCMNLTSSQTGQLANLKNGEAVVLSADDDCASLIKVKYEELV